MAALLALYTHTKGPATVTLELAKMTDTVLNGNLPAEETEELVDYEEEAEDQAGQAKAGDAPAKKGYVGIHSTGFKDFLLKPELLRAIVDCGFEHPSEGQRLGVSGSYCSVAQLRSQQEPGI